MELKDDLNYADKRIIKTVFDIFGWNLKEVKEYDNVALIRADFYPVGYVLAISNKAIIICEGQSVFTYKNKEYNDFEELLNTIGSRAYSTFPNWQVGMEKEWTIRKNGEWIGSFSNLSDMPYRKQVRC